MTKSPQSFVFVLVIAVACTVIPPKPQPATTATACSIAERAYQPELFAAGVLALSNSRYLWNPHTGQNNSLPTSNVPARSFLGLVASPDRKWVAYVETALDSENHLVGQLLHIVAASGRESNTYQWEKDWASWRWINDHEILISDSRVISGSAIILDVFSGRQATLPVAFSDTLGPDRPITVYSPTLTQVVYLKNTARNSQYILKDVMSQKILWQGVDNSPNPFEPPKWLLDGSRFAVISTRNDPDHSDIYVVDQTGREVRLTNGSANFLAYVSSLEWSPAGQLIAYWSNERQDQTGPIRHKLLIVDTKSGHSEDYCVTTDEDVPSAPILWSPNGEQVIVRVVKGNKSMFVLIDRHDGFIMPLPDEMEPAAWVIE